MTVVDTGRSVDTPIREELRPSMIERMTLILDAFHGTTRPLTHSDVMRRTQLPRSTVHRILDQLVHSNWLEHTPLGYRLGSRAYSFGGSSHNEIRSAAAPLLHELHMRTGMVVHLVVLDGSDSLCLDKVGGRFATTLPSRVGGRSPAYATAAGRSMLAWLAPERVDHLCRERPSICTDRTAPDMPTLHMQLTRIRQRGGLAFDRGESVNGVACVGVAIRGAGTPIAGISLCGDARTAQLDHVAPLVIEAARKISRTLHPTTLSSRT